MSIDLSLSDLLAIVFALATIFGGVAWGRLFVKGRRVWTNMKALQAEYLEAKLDGHVSDEEKLEMSDTVMEIVTDASDIWQVGENLVSKVLPLLKKGKQ